MSKIKKIKINNVLYDLEARESAETDPIFSASPSFSITSENITNWNNKLDTSKVKNTSSTTAGDVYDVTYINTMIGNIETLLSEV